MSLTRAGAVTLRDIARATGVSVNTVSRALTGKSDINAATKIRVLATAERLGLKPEAVVVNIDRFGNTTAGTIPLAMNTALEEGKLKKGSLVLLASVGAGFTVGATLLRWAY